MKFWFCLSIFGYFCTVSVRSHTTSCTTPNDEKTTCKSLLSCPVLRNALTSKDPSVERFVEASTSACGSGTLGVCCGTYGNYTALNNVNVSQEEMPLSVESRREFAVKNLPSKKYCGMQNADDYFRDYNTRETTVDEFPWIMFVSCENSDGPIASSLTQGGFPITSRDCDCSGVLISNRYVLTASNCASAKWVGLWQREQYRNISCSETPYGDDCSEAPKTPFIEQIRSPDNSLLLLRLENKISYTDYVRPICLPLEESDRITIGDTVTTSKWEIDDRVRGFIRTKLNQTIISNEECCGNFEELKLHRSSKYMCTRLEDDVTVLCKTDSGSPMMYKRKNNWFVGGILHSEPCFTKTAVGNRITSEVVNWILENMKP